MIHTKATDMQSEIDALIQRKKKLIEDWCHDYWHYDMQQREIESINNMSSIK